MEHKAPEPLLSYEEVQRVIDERLEAILQEEASDPGLVMSGQGRPGTINYKLKEFWSKLTKNNKK